MRPGKTTVLHFGSQIVISVSGFIASLAIVRLLGGAELGIYSVGVALVFWANVPAAAVGDAIKKRLSTGGKPGPHLTAGTLLVLGPSLIVVAAIIVFPGVVESYLTRDTENLLISAPLAPLLAGMVVATQIFSLSIDVLQGQKRVATAGLTQAAERLSRTVAQITLVLVGYGIASLFVGHLVSAVLGSLIVFGVLGIRRPGVSREHILSLYEYARYSWVGSVETRAFAWMDTIVLGFFVSRELIGIYEVSWNLASLLALVAISIQLTLFPELSELADGKEQERIRHFLNEGLVFTGIFLIPGLIGAALVGKRVLKIYDPIFTQGLPVLLVLILAQGIAAYGRQLVSVINALDRPDIAFRINAAFVVANAILNVLFVWQIGWLGAAIATCLSASLILSLGYRSLTALIGKPGLPLKEIIHEVTAAVGMAVIVFLGRIVAPQNHYATVALVGIGATVYLALLLVLSDRIRDKAIGLARTANG